MDSRLQDLMVGTDFVVAATVIRKRTRLDRVRVEVVLDGTPVGTVAYLLGETVVTPVGRSPVGHESVRAKARKRGR